MTADRHALNAALDYSHGLELTIARLKEQCQEEQMRVDHLRGQVRDVKDAVKDRDRPEPTNQACEASAPHAKSPGNEGFSTRGQIVCKHCGRPPV